MLRVLNRLVATRVPQWKHKLIHIKRKNKREFNIKKPVLVNKKLNEPTSLKTLTIFKLTNLFNNKTPLLLDWAAKLT